MRAPEIPDKIVFYDGICALCNVTVKILLRIDRSQTLHYAALQGETARSLLAPEQLEGLPSIVYRVQPSLLYQESEAVLRILIDLGLPWKLFGIFLLVPKAVRDWCYRFVARNRYAVFGKYDVCPIPPEGVRDRFLD